MIDINNRMEIDKLLKYEMWSIAEWVSWGWLQEIIARLVANQVKRKIRRYNKRIEREVFVLSSLKDTKSSEKTEEINNK